MRRTPMASCFRIWLMRVLSRHRQTLLDTVHQNEKRIDCLDYLVYTLKKQNKSQ